MKQKNDLVVTGSGTIYLLHGVSDEGKTWIEDQLPPDAQTLGKAIAIEHRYIGDIIEGARADGLIVGYRNVR